MGLMISSGLHEEALAATLSRVSEVLRLDRGCLGARPGPPAPGARWGRPPSVGSAPFRGSRQLGPHAKLLGSSGKADLGQEEPGRGTNDSLSHILRGKNPAVCVAFEAGRYCRLGFPHSPNKSAQPATRASLGMRPVTLFRRPVPHAFSALGGFKIPSIEHDGFHFQK